VKQEAVAQFQPFPGISEQVYSRNDFAAICELIYQESANLLPPSKSTLVYSRLAPLVRTSGAGTFGEYIKRLRIDDDERRKAVNALTTNHTGFFREQHHFDHLREVARPELVQRIERGEPVRIWSAGCSSGEEVYSACMTLLGHKRVEARQFLSSNVATLATDLADHVLAKAKAATYDVEALSPVPFELRAEWIKMSNGTGTMSDPVRDMVRFRRLNLTHDWPFSRQFDIIFCRNVMIYFDLPTKERLVARFANLLKPGGYLYIGHSERVTGSANNSLELVGKTIYQRTR